MIEPMLAKPAEPTQLDQFLDDPAWAIEPKCDGNRVLIHVDGTGGVHPYTRQGLPTFLPGPVKDAFAAIAHSEAEFVLDGELLGSTLVLFDLPSAGTQIEAGHSLHVRRSALERLHTVWAPTPAVRLVPQAKTTDEKIKMIDRVITGRGEGLMAKAADSTYQTGNRSGDWRKIKRHHTVDCVVTWLGTEKQNLGVGVYDPGGRLVEIGEVGRLTGDGPKLQPGDVAEIRVLYVTDDDRLYQPTLPKLRTDKTPEECLLADLDGARTNKNLVLTWENRS